jgi:hypothetical protein
MNKQSHNPAIIVCNLDWLILGTMGAVGVVSSPPGVVFLSSAMNVRLNNLLYVFSAPETTSMSGDSLCVSHSESLNEDRPAKYGYSKALKEEKQTVY